jgi:hypothetical protein
VSQENLELLEAMQKQLSVIWPENDFLITRVVLVLEVLPPSSPNPSVCSLNFGADGEGLPRWQTIGLLHAAVIDFEHQFTHSD